MTQPSHEGNRGAGHATVLVVDDQAANRELARHTLEDDGYRVRMAASGREALEILEHERADCVLLDIRMPDLDGFEVCQRLRALPEAAGTPVLFLTAVREADVLEQALGMGAFDFLTKPIKPAELLMRVATALRVSRLGNERDELHAMLQRQRDDLLRLSLQKERLSTFLVHDLKNPVFGIKLAGELLLVDAQGSPRSKEVGKRISQESSRLLRMIQNLLDISRADEEQLVPSCTEFEVGPLLGEVFSVLALQAQIRDIELRSKAEARLSADREMIRRLFENLLDNALHYAPRGSTVLVEAARRSHGLELFVRDAGPGVPLELRESIFERYVQAAPAKGRTGQGLGLAFCKVVVETHGGKIWVEDGEPGTVFRIWLPDVIPSETAAPRGPSRDPRPGPAS
jgi:two-component system sensor histidine kinase/response regulator